MHGTIFIRLSGGTAGPDDPVGWRVRAPETFTGPQQGTLADAAEAATGMRAVILVPQEEVLMTRAEVPTRHGHRMRQAVPFALEEQLASDVEQLHFALGERDDEDLLAVAVVSRHRMGQWLDALAEAGIAPHAMYGDAVLVPDDETLALAAEPGRLLVRAPHVAHALEADAAGLELPLVLSTIEAERAVLYDCGEPELRGSVEQVCQARQLPLEVRECNAGLLGLVEQRPPATIDLLQGPYSRREKIGRLWRPWRTAAALLGAIVLIQLGMAVAEYRHLSARDQELAAQIEAVYREAIPGARNVVNPRVQMERQLQALRGGTAGAGGFPELMELAGPVLSSAPDLQIRSLRYRERTIELDLELASLQALDGLRSALQETGLDVDIAAANSRNGKVEGRLTIGSRA